MTHWKLSTETSENARHVFGVFITSCSLLFGSIGNSASVDEISKPDAARFLERATLGFDGSDLQHLIDIGYPDWIDQQLKARPSYNQPYIDYLNSRSDIDRKELSADISYHKINSPRTTVGYRNTSTAWLRAVMRGDDQLRQRVAWSLSQIFVVSNDSHVLTRASSQFYDMLLNNAFADFEELLMEVTLHPVMGRYLSYLGNSKAKGNTVPDENYAREVMQLFTIGLWELNLDGTLKLDVNTGKPTPTYDTKDVRELAKVFTGLWVEKSAYRRKNYSGYMSPMVMHERFHDRSTKSALDGYINIDKGQSGLEDIQQTINKLVKHQNTAPFISKKLIQFLVTSNPDPSYVQRVVKVWLETEGNLGMVVKAILLDPGIAEKSTPEAYFFGRVKEPIQRFVSVLKAFDCGGAAEPAALPGLQWWNPPPINMIFQEPLRSPSVFGFFSDSFSVQENADTIMAPEFQLLDDVGIAKVTNYMWASIQGKFHTPVNGKADASSACRKFSDFNSIEDAVAYANLVLAGGRVSKETQAAIINVVKENAPPLQRVKRAVFGIAVSPESVIQR